MNTRTLYLMRHGEAAWTRPDSERELTDLGREQTQQVLAAMGPRLAQLKALYSSPYRRAQQTLAEVERLTGLKAAAYHDFLTPDQPAQRVLEQFDPYLQDQTLIVAHQPLLGNLVSLLVEGSLAHSYPFTTSEVVQLELHEWAPGCARLLQAWSS